MVKKIIVGIDERGNPLGEYHHRAKLSDADVDFIRAVYDEGFCSYTTLALVFDVSKSTIRDIVKFRRRATTPVDYRKIEVDKLRPRPVDRLLKLRGIPMPD